MAPKGKTSQREDLKQEDILQAVVIADSFNVRFGPVTERRPRVNQNRFFRKRHDEQKGLPPSQVTNLIKSDRHRL